MTQQWDDDWQSVARKKAPRRGTTGSEGGSDAGQLEGASAGEQPSPRLWLSRLLPTVTDIVVRTELSRFGVLTDAEVFPSPRGPLKFAFVTFARLEDAVRAYDELGSQMVPTLSGRLKLKIRYNPAEGGKQAPRQQQQGAAAAASRLRAPAGAPAPSSSKTSVGAVAAAPAGKGTSNASKRLPGAIQTIQHRQAAQPPAQPPMQQGLPAQPSGGSNAWPTFPDPWQAPMTADPWQTPMTADPWQAPAAPEKDPWAGLVAAAKKHWPAADEPAAAAGQLGAQVQAPALPLGTGLPAGGWAAGADAPLGGLIGLPPAGQSLPQGWGGAGKAEAEEDAELQRLLSLLCT